MADEERKQNTESPEVKQDTPEQTHAPENGDTIPKQNNPSDQDNRSLKAESPEINQKVSTEEAKNSDKGKKDSLKIDENLEKDKKESSKKDEIPDKIQKDLSKKEENLDRDKKDSLKKDENPDKDDNDSLKKNESPDKLKREAKSEKNVKKHKKEEESENDHEEDAESSDSEESLPPGLLELPLEVEGKREKKKVERLTASMIRSPQEKKKIEFEEGSGQKLGDIPFVEHRINNTKVMDLKSLHRVLYHRAGTSTEVKKNIRQFSGFNFDKDSKEYEKRLASLNKMVMSEIKKICQILGLERTGTKVGLVERVMDFLMQPEDKGHKVKVKAKRKSKSTGGKTKATKKKPKAAGKKGKASKDKDEEDSGADESEEEKEEDQEEEGEEADEEEEEEEEEEESEEEVPRKKKKTENKKTPKKSVKENGKKEKTPAKNEKTPAKKETKKTESAKKRPILSGTDEDSASEEEPVTKVQKLPPSNEEIKELVKKLLDGADLETVTMKTVVKQVYDKYPSFDLSDRKDFIKDTVKKIIS